MRNPFAQLLLAAVAHVRRPALLRFDDPARQQHFAQHHDRMRLQARYSRSKYQPHDNGPGQRKANRERRQFDRNTRSAARRHNDAMYAKIERLRDEGAL